MARPKNSQYLARNCSAIRRAQDWRTQEGHDLLWTRMIDMYRGKQYNGQASEDRMLINLAFATKNVIAPSVAVNNPKFVVNARKPEGAAQAIITEQVLNYLWRSHRYQEEFRLAVDDFLELGHGWVKVGYKATKPAVLKTLPLAMEGDAGDETEGVDDRDETVVGNVESEVRSFDDDDRPFAERISPFDIFVDPDARHPKEMKWIAQRVRRPVADVMVDSRYDAKARARASSNLLRARVDDNSRALDGHPEETDVAYVDVWEFYDIRKNTVATFILESEDDFLIAPVKMPYAFGHPFVMLRNYEVIDQFYPMGELEAIEQLQQELNATRTQMMNHRKRYQRKILYDTEAFDPAGIKALLDDKDNVLVPVNTQAASVDISKVVSPMPQMGTPPDFYNQSELISSDIDRVSGVSDYMRGAQADIRRTATEAAMIQDAQNARAADKLARIEGVLAQIGGRIVQLMQQFMTGDRVVRIAGMSAAPVWIGFDADFIQGEFDFEVEAGSTQPRNDSFRRQSALQLVDAMGPFVQMGVVDPMALARHVLQFGFDVKDPSSFMMQQQAAPGAPTPEGQPPGAPPVPGPQNPMEEQAEGPASNPAEEGVESPIEGIPPELIAQLMGQQGLPTS